MKNIYPGGHKFTFFNRFFRDILLSALVSFAFFVFLFFFLLVRFLKLEIHILIQGYFFSLTTHIQTHIYTYVKLFVIWFKIPHTQMLHHVTTSQLNPSKSQITDFHKMWNTRVGNPRTECSERANALKVNENNT